MALELAPLNERVVAAAPGVVHASLLPGKEADHDLRTELEQPVPSGRLTDPGEIGLGQQSNSSPRMARPM
jgi:NAD(P)-dependent dehydrogenase (short-subunit alcohol dehydrogenase family)